MSNALHESSWKSTPLEGPLRTRIDEDITAHKEAMAHELTSLGLLALIIGVAAIGAEALVMSPMLDDIGKSLNSSPGGLGSAVAAYGIALAIAAPLFGLYGQRIGRVKLMLSGLGLFILSTLACGIAWREELLIAARAACGVSAGAFLPTCYAFIGDTVPYDRRAKVMGRIMFGWSLSLVVGVPLGGFIGQLLGWRMTFVFVAIAGAIALGLLSGFAVRYKPSKSVEPASATVRWQLPSPVFYVFGATFLNMLGFYGVYTYLGTAVREAQAIGSAGASAYVLCYGIGLAFSTLRGDILDRLGKVRVLSMALLLLCPLFLVQSVTIGHPVLLAAVMCAWGLLQGAVLTGLNTVLTQQAGERRGLATALNSSLTYFAVALSALLGGLVIDDSSGFAQICVAAAVSSLVSWLALRGSRITA
ncbi:MAG: ywfA [Microvirga sp.]|jgi:DHA1 family inner membrane transport protein|nr:ywfA [Microvirga sp.]